MATATAWAPSITLSTNLWFDWAQIAISHAHSAQEARQRLTRAHREEDLQLRESHFIAEMHASMVATTAAASALAGLDGVVRPHVDSALVASWSGKPAHEQRRLAVDHCYRCTGDIPTTMVTEYGWLFRLLRNPGVHHRPALNPPVLHPVPGVGSASSERVLYATEATNRAVDFMMLVIEIACNPALARQRDVAEAAESLRPLSRQLREAWPGTPQRGGVEDHTQSS
jgi:hypothetical protein